MGLRQTDFQHAPLITLKRLLEYVDSVQPISELYEWAMRGDVSVPLNDYYLPDDAELLD